MPNSAANEADIIAANERLTAELAAATTERDQLRAQLAQANETRNTATNLLTEANQRVSSLTEERDGARTSLQAMTADRDRLAGESRDFNRRLAGELAKHGIRADGVAPGSNAGSEALGTLTEQCRAILGR